MARLIDADALMDDVEMDGALYACLGAVDDVRFLVDSQPTVDAVEVVRCKDCKSWKCLMEDRGLCKHPTFTLEDDAIDPLTKPNDFCSYGERREGE